MRLIFYPNIDLTILIIHIRYMDFNKQFCVFYINEEEVSIHFILLITLLQILFIQTNTQ